MRVGCVFHSHGWLQAHARRPGVECHTQKGETAAEDFLRSLYRQRRLTSAELDARQRALEALAAGELRPILAPPAAVIRNQKNPNAPHGNV